MSSNPTQTVSVDDLAGMVATPDDFTTHISTLERKFQNKFGKSLTITGGAGTRLHRELHAGNARDIRSKDLTAEQRNWIIEFGTRKGLLAADYTDPTVNPNKVKQPHIHIQAKDRHPAPRAGIQTMSVADLEQSVQPRQTANPLDEFLDSLDRFHETVLSKKPEPDALQTFGRSFLSTLGIPTSGQEAKEMVSQVGKTVYHALKGDLSRDISAALEGKKTETLVGGMTAAQVNELKKARKAYKEGDTVEAIGHAGAGILPIFGPMAGRAGEQLGKGDVAGGLGTTAGIAGLVFGPKLVKTGMKGLKGAKAIEPEVLSAEPGGGLPKGPPEPTVVEGELTPKAYRTRSVGEQGIPASGRPQATSSLERAFEYRKPRGELTGKPQETVQIDLKRLAPSDYETVTGPNGENWIKFNGNIPESHLTVIPPEMLPGVSRAPSSAPIAAVLRANPGAAEALAPPGQFSSLEPVPPTYEGQPVVEQGLTTPPPGTTGPYVNQPTAQGQLPPAPGPHVMKDVAWYKAEFGSPDQVMETRPETAPIAQVLTRAADESGKFVGGFERSLASTIKGFNRAARREVGDILDNYADPQQAFGQQSTRLGRAYSGRSVVAAIQARRILDTVHSMFPQPFTRANTNVGYIQAYLTHIEEMLGTDSDLLAGVKQAWEYHFKRPLQSIRGLFAEPDIQMTGRNRPIMGTTGHPTSVFTRHRSGALSVAELDVKRVFPAYVESAKRAIFDKPAVDAAISVAEKLPKSNLRDLATATIRNFSRYDAYPGLSQAWDSFTSGLMRTHARSVLGLSTGLQALHFARIWGNLLPALETKYFLHGWKQLMTHPIESYRTVAKLGMLTGEIRPSAFKTLSEKFDSLMQLKSAADFMDRAIGYHGFKKMYLDRGMSAYDAEMAALKSTKRASMFPDPVRTAKVFMTERGVGSSAIGKLALQYKQVPVKIIEQYVRIAAQAKSNPAAFGRMMAGLGLLVTAQQVLGIKSLHLNIKNLLDLRGATPAEIIKIFDLAGKGKIEEAIEESLLILTPGGKSIQHQLESGPSAFEKEPKEKKPGLEKIKGLKP